MCHHLMKESRENLNSKYGGKDVTAVDNIAFVTCGGRPDVELMIRESNNEKSPAVLIEECYMGYEVMFSQGDLDDYAAGGFPGIDQILEARETLKQIISSWLI